MDETLQPVFDEVVARNPGEVELAAPPPSGSPPLISAVSR
jgi:hypothetical protein